MMEYITNDELRRFTEGKWTDCYEKLGAHSMRMDGEEGYMFAVWAPNVKSVRVTGSFNNWKNDEFAMQPAGYGGVWQLFVPGVKEGDLYKYVIETWNGELLYKADPYAFYAQMPPETASRTADISGYKWKDSAWLARRKRFGHMKRPMNIYEVHLGSWKRNGNGERDYYTYEQLAEELVPYVADMGYTHIELLPVMEHPFDGSWGYQLTGYYAATSRYGEPQGLMRFVDACHNAGIGVILDWVPGHFCRDAHGLGRFNGEMLYEKYDHIQWGTYKFDFGRNEVRNFLVSNALFWVEKYHADGIRVDGVTSMIYLNFGIEDEGQKHYNEHGGQEDLRALDFMRELNWTMGTRHPDVFMIAEESTAWPLVTYPPEDGGLGFNYKWDMGWMNDTLRYMQTDFPFKKWKHNLLTFSMMYAFNENFILPLSHDEVVHGKCSLIVRMPGDYWKQFAGMRALFLYQMCHPGAKLNFMGNEIAQFIEWRYYESIEWFLTEYELHGKYQQFVKSLNHLYKAERALWRNNYSWEGFEWIDADNSDQYIISFIRRGDKPGEEIVVVVNFGTEEYSDYRIGVPRQGKYKEIFTTDLTEYGGAGCTNEGLIKTENIPWHGKNQSISLRIPQIGGIILKRTAK